VTRKALVHGDFHASTKDAKSLLNRDTRSTDAVFIEGRSDTIKVENYSAGYILWLIGYLSLELIYATSAWIRRVLPGGDFDVREEARSRGIAVEDEIDAELHEVWSLAEPTRRRYLYYHSLLVAAYVLTYPLYGSIGVTLVLLAWLIPLGYSAGVLIFGVAHDGLRDDIMSESVVDIAEREDYEEVLVFCGQSHVEGITEQLLEEGWDVEYQDSTHFLSTLGSWI